MERAPRFVSRLFICRSSTSQRSKSVFVADYSRLTKAKEQDKLFYAAIDTGFISQNIYLYCASEGLDTVVHMAGDSAALAKTMQLRPDQKVVIAQAVGWPRK